MAPKPQNSDALTTPSRRLHPRFSVGGRIQCEIQGPDVVVALLNVSRGGFLVRSPIKARVGDLQRYRFIIEAEHHYIFVLRAQVIHCAASDADGVTTYLTGLQFVDVGTRVSERAIGLLIDVMGR